MGLTKLRRVFSKTMISETQTMRSTTDFWAAATHLSRGSALRTVLFGLLPLAAIFYVLVPLVLGGAPYWLNVFTNAALLSIASLGVWLTFAIGRVNIAQGGFCLLGAYVTGILSTRYGVPFWLCLPISAAVAAALGIIVGWPLLRLRGIYFAMVSLSMTEAIRLTFVMVTNAMGGGITNIPRPTGFESPIGFYLFAVTLLLVAYLVVWRLSASRLGWVFRSMRQNEELASSIGIDVAKYRILAFAICSAMGGITGASFASFQQNVYPTTFTIADSINFMLYSFLGGLEFVLGPIVGTFGLVISFELLRSIQQYQALLYGLLMIMAMLFLPNGLLSLIPEIGKRWRGKP